jgi:outer membrane biosynthesis protein TonB
MSDSKRGAKMSRLIAGLMAALMLTACSGGGDGTSREDLLKLAGESVATVQPTNAPQAQISPTETPDYQPAPPVPQIAPTATPAPPQAMPEPTPAPVVAQDLQSLAVIGELCDPYTAREIPLDDADRRGGVIIKGGGCVEVTR